MRGPAAARLEPTDLHLWVIELPGEHLPAPAPCSCLSPEECRRATVFRAERDRVRFLATRAALRHLLGVYLGIEPGSVRLEASGSGKPYLGAGPASRDIRFNCAHSGSLALVGLACGGWEVGVDVEECRPIPSLGSLADQVLSRPERAAYDRVAEARRTPFFYRCWVRKEALGKALGTGIVETLPAVDLSVPGTAAVPDPRSPTGRWHVGDIPLDGPYAAAFCVPAGMRRVRLFRYPAEETS